MATKTLRLHVRVFASTRAYPPADLIQNARDVLDKADIGLDIRTNKVVTDRKHLVDILLESFEEMSDIQRREDVTDRREIVVYMVNSTHPTNFGLSAPGDTEPWIIITTKTSAWTLAHEIGHLLGIGDPHVTDTDRLMTGSTHDITKTPPIFDQNEIDTIQSSDLLF